MKDVFHMHNSYSRVKKNLMGKRDYSVNLTKLSAHLSN
jgi:hypothetical protein